MSKYRHSFDNPANKQCASCKFWYDCGVEGFCMNSIHSGYQDIRCYNSCEFWENKNPEEGASSMKKFLLGISMVLVTLQVVFWLTGGSISRGADGEFIIWWPWE